MAFNRNILYVPGGDDIIRRFDLAAPAAPVALSDLVLGLDVKIIALGVYSNGDLALLDSKLGKLIQFLEAGDKAKVTLRFRGREMAHQEFGVRLLERVRADLVSVGIVEQFPKLEGRQMVMVLAPKKKGVPPKAKAKPKSKKEAATATEAAVKPAA